MVIFVELKNKILTNKVVGYTSNFVVSHTSKGNELIISDLQYISTWKYGLCSECNRWMFHTITLGKAFKIDNSSPFYKKMHILGVVYLAICESKVLFMKRSGEKYIHLLFIGNKVEIVRDQNSWS